MKSIQNFLIFTLVLIIGMWVIVIDTLQPLPYVKPIYYGDVKIKIYSEDIDKLEVLSQLKRIPDKYLVDVRIIRFYSNHYGCGKKYSGLYYEFFKEIRVCDGFDTLIHELAHHKVYVEGQDMHGVLFDKAYEDIRGDIYERKN